MGSRGCDDGAFGFVAAFGGAMMDSGAATKTKTKRQPLPLFDRLAVNESVLSAEVDRLGGQAGKILKMLQAGAVTTSQMAAVARQYNARLSEVRRAIHPMGLDVKLIQRNTGTGDNVYELRPWSDQEAN